MSVSWNLPPFDFEDVFLIYDRLYKYRTRRGDIGKDRRDLYYNLRYLKNKRSQDLRTLINIRKTFLNYYWKSDVIHAINCVKRSLREYSSNLSRRRSLSHSAGAGSPTHSASPIQIPRNNSQTRNSCATASPRTPSPIQRPRISSQTRNSSSTASCFASPIQPIQSPRNSSQARNSSPTASRIASPIQSPWNSSQTSKSSATASSIASPIQSPRNNSQTSNSFAIASQHTASPTQTTLVNSQTCTSSDNHSQQFASPSKKQKKSILSTSSFTNSSQQIASPIQKPRDNGKTSNWSANESQQVPGPSHSRIQTDINPEILLSSDDENYDDNSIIMDSLIKKEVDYKQEEDFVKMEEYKEEDYIIPSTRSEMATQTSRSRRRPPIKAEVLVKIGSKSQMKGRMHHQQEERKQRILHYRDVLKKFNLKGFPPLGPWMASNDNGHSSEDGIGCRNRQLTMAQLQEKDEKMNVEIGKMDQQLDEMDNMIQQCEDILRQNNLEDEILWPLCPRQTNFN